MASSSSGNAAHGEESAAVLLSTSEGMFPEQLIPIFRQAGALERSPSSQRGLPRCAWGYLYRLASELWTLGNSTTAVDQKQESERRALLVKLRTTFRSECDFIVDDRDAANLLRNLREATALLDEAAVSSEAAMRDLAVEEIEHIVAQFPTDDAWEMLLTVADESDELSTVSDKWTLETLGRAGGEEASIFAREMKEMYRTYCEKVRRWQVEDISEPDAAGGTLRLQGRDIYKIMRHEIGVHRVQRIPVTEASGRMQTSTASVFLLPQPSAVSVNINPDDVEIDMCRGSGPGGQGVNSSSNMCRLHHKPTGIAIRCHASRSGNANRDMAMDMLAQKLWKEKYRSSRKQQDDVFSSQWGTGERGERMRTYNFPQNRITDHRLNNWTCNMANAFMTGVGPLEELHDLAIAGSVSERVQTAMDSRANSLTQVLSTK